MEIVQFIVVQPWGNSGTMQKLMNRRCVLSCETTGAIRILCCNVSVTQLIPVMKKWCVEEGV